MQRQRSQRWRISSSSNGGLAPSGGLVPFRHMPVSARSGSRTTASVGPWMIRAISLRSFFDGHFVRMDQPGAGRWHERHHRRPCRVLAARQLAMAEVPCIELAHLSEAQRRAYIITPCRIASITSRRSWLNSLRGDWLSEPNDEGHREAGR
jgi:hypothetical protein